MTIFSSLYLDYKYFEPPTRSSIMCCYPITHPSDVPGPYDWNEQTVSVQNKWLYFTNLVLLTDFSKFAQLWCMVTVHVCVMSHVDVTDLTSFSLLVLPVMASCCSLRLTGSICNCGVPPVLLHRTATEERQRWAVFGHQWWVMTMSVRDVREYNYTR